VFINPELLISRSVLRSISLLISSSVKGAQSTYPLQHSDSELELGLGLRLERDQGTLCHDNGERRPANDSIGGSLRLEFCVEVADWSDGNGVREGNDGGGKELDMDGAVTGREVAGGGIGTCAAKLENAIS
jgi:hypothetical protein